MKYKKLLVLAAISLTAVGALAATNLVSNGSFESGLAGWSVSSGNGNSKGTTDILRTKGGYESSSYVELNSKAGISQDISATGLVELSFWSLGVANGKGNTDQVKVTFDNKTVAMALKGNKNSNTGQVWSQYTQQIDLEKTKSARLTFVGLVKPDSFGGRIDNISMTAVPVSPVPEPQTYAMLLAGLGLVGAVVRRRKQASAT